jgi:hypothetical protein
VDAEPLTRLAAAVAERRQDLERVTPQDMNQRVLAVCDIKKRLLRICITNRPSCPGSNGGGWS